LLAGLRRKSEVYYDDFISRIIGWNYTKIDKLLNCFKPFIEQEGFDYEV